jgi:hypothetical protein
MLHKGSVHCLCEICLSDAVHSVMVCVCVCTFFPGQAAYNLMRQQAYHDGDHLL